MSDSVTSERIPSRKQSLEALAIGNEVRMAQARVCRELKSGPRLRSLELAVRMLEEESDAVLNCRLDRFLRAIYRFPKAKQLKAYRYIRVGPAPVKIGQLSQAQRTLLVRYLRSQV